MSRSVRVGGGGPAFFDPEPLGRRALGRRPLLGGRTRIAGSWPQCPQPYQQPHQPQGLLVHGLSGGAGRSGSGWCRGRRRPTGAARCRSAGTARRPARSTRARAGCGRGRPRRSGSPAAWCRRWRSPARATSRRATSRRAASARVIVRRAGCDPGPPERLVRVDVADAGQRALREELGLHVRLAAAQGPPQPAVVERLVPRLGALGRERRQAGVLAGGHHADAPEAADVAQLEHLAVVERPPRPHVRVERAGPEAELAGHPEVDDQLPPVVQADEQVLAPAVHALDRRTDGLDRRRRTWPTDGPTRRGSGGRPRAAASARRTVSTSGSSGTGGP